MLALKVDKIPSLSNYGHKQKVGLAIEETKVEN